MQVEMYPANNTAILPLGTQRKGVDPTIVNKDVKQEGRHSQNKATEQQESTMTHGSAHTDRKPSTLDREVRETGKMPSIRTNNTSKRDHIKRVENYETNVDTQYITDIYVRRE